jgi:DNA-binding transcriptional LysR family regulator
MSRHEEGLVLPSWDDIRYFLAVAREGSLSAAAKSLGVDHTTVGRRLKALEARLGAVLFLRRDNRMALTPSGEIALGEAREIEARVVAFARKLSGSDGRIAGEVRLNVTEGLATYWLMPRLRPFQEANPALQVHVQFAYTGWLDLGSEADVALRLERPTEPRLVAKKLGDVAYSMFAMPEYAQQFGLPASLEEMQGHRFIQYNTYELNAHLAPWNALMARIGPALRTANTILSQAALDTGGYIALLPDYAAIIDPRVVKAPLALGIKVPVWLAYHEDRRNAARVRAVTSEIQRLFEADRGTWFI